MKKYLFGFCLYFIIVFGFVGFALFISRILEINEKSFLMVMGYWAFSLARDISSFIEREVTERWS